MALEIGAGISCEASQAPELQASSTLLTSLGADAQRWRQRCRDAARRVQERWGVELVSEVWGGCPVERFQYSVMVIHSS